MAALDMVQDMEALKKKYHLENVEFGIKIGLNEGPALAVNADERLDYFGQSVNVAARVQNLAQSGEIWITETVYNGYGVREMLESCGCTLQPKSVALRGVNQEVTVYQCVG
jgi:class 3 adenylate cyclase